MSDADVMYLGFLAEAASPGPWDRVVGPYKDSNNQTYCAPGEELPVLYAYGPHAPANIEFARAAREHVPALVHEVMRLRELLSRVRSACGMPDPAEACRLILHLTKEKENADECQ